MMKNSLKGIIFLASLSISVKLNAQNNDTLYRFCDSVNCELGCKMGYRNVDGDTVIALGKFADCSMLTFTSFAIVTTRHGRSIGIDRNGKELYEVCWTDNMPDYFFAKDYGEVDLFKIKVNGLIGFADFNGKIIIQPQFECAGLFTNGKCWVAKNCELIPDGEYMAMKSDEGYYIDVQGRRIEGE